MISPFFTVIQFYWWQNLDLRSVMHECDQQVATGAYLKVDKHGRHYDCVLGLHE